ncbi:MAG: hypothetical protein SNH13_00125 [Rikenellaceae bacterium]
MENINIAGQNIGLKKLGKSDLAGVFVDAILRFAFYMAVGMNLSFYLLEAKKQGRLTPLQYKQLSIRLMAVLAIPIVFKFDKLEAYERNRLIAMGVFFIVSGKYAYLPNLIITEKEKASQCSDSLTPIAQYILLFHLQSQSLQGATIKEIEKLTPYKYVTLTRAVSCLEQLGLCHTQRNESRSKQLKFDSNSALWERAQKYLISPIAKTVYCNNSNLDYAVSSYNALAHYSNLNPNDTPSVAIYESEYKKIEKDLVDVNSIEGDVKIEMWRYPPIGTEIVDKLSLYLTLKDDKDPRVEKELEKMMEKIWL